MTFTPSSSGNTGVVVIDISSTAAGYICAIEIDSESSSISAPQISPANGTEISGTQSVTISQAEGKNIYYTTDGSNPDATKALYTGAFDVSASLVTGEVTVKAVAIDGTTSSVVTSVTYTDPSIQPLIVSFTFGNSLFGTNYNGAVSKETIEAAGGKLSNTTKNVRVEYALGTGSNYYVKTLLSKEIFP